jgi:hypothetical protein
VRSLLLLAIVAVGCTKADAPQKVPEGLVRVSDEHVVGRTATVGEGRDHYDDQYVTHQKGAVFAQSATFALVDAQNISDHDLLITLGGELIDARGATVSSVRPESLRVPSGASRTFVLVDDTDQPRPTATGAKVVVRGAVPPTWSPTVTLSDGHTFDDHGKVMVAASVHNEADREGSVIVLAGFHAGDQPVARQFDLLRLGPKETKVVRFTGPEGATTGVIWLGDSNY